MLAQSTALQRAGLLFSALVCVALLCGWALEQQAPSQFYRLAQEDGPLEWATFWAFLLAGLAALRLLRQTPSSALARSYAVVLGMGCLLVAFEEISWGQRVFAYAPPPLFLAENFQQEANLHNLAPTQLRQAALLLLLGFGVLWPLIGRAAGFARWLHTRAVMLPSLTAMPGFILAAALYLLYPWEFTGEWVELCAGVGMLLSLAPMGDERRALRRVSGGLLLTGVLAALTPALVPALDDPERLAAAQQEVAALAEDFRTKRLRSRCGVHKRIYTFVEEYGARRMESGAFWASAAPDQRRRFYLDPWHMPYWVRHRCAGGADEEILVYSFGPNRSRDSTASVLRADDIGQFVP